MKRVYKYRLEVTDTQAVSLPVGAKILTVQVQGGDPHLWALVDPAAEIEPRRLRIHSTGHDIDGAERLSFIGTFQLAGGSLVFHVFEEVPDAH